MNKLMMTVLVCLVVFTMSGCNKISVGKAEIKLVSYQTSIINDEPVLKGVLQNVGSEDALYVNITATLYDAGNVQKALGIDLGGLMKPGDKFDFTIDFSTSFLWSQIKRIEYSLMWVEPESVMEGEARGTINL